MSDSIYLLRHLSTNTYYGIKKHNNHNKHQNFVSTSTFDSDSVSQPSQVSPMFPKYNVVGFKKFTDAVVVADSIATYRTLHSNKNPDDTK